ncbi:MAG: 4Fe-4S binding protein [bacterium]
MPKIIIDENRCKGCQLCIIECPNDCIEMSLDLNPSGHHTAKLKHGARCNGCGLCFQICPDCCIEVYK